MENIVEQLAEIQTQAAINIDLLKIAKGYCDYHLGKCSEISALSSLLEIILKAQVELANRLDDVT